MLFNVNIRYMMIKYLNNSVTRKKNKYEQHISKLNVRLLFSCYSNVKKFLGIISNRMRKTVYFPATTSCIYHGRYNKKDVCHDFK